MTENGGNLSIRVSYDVDRSSESKVENSINKLKSKSGSVENAFTKSFGKIGKAAIAAFSIASITKFINAADAAYKVQSVAESKLETIMRKRMGATDSEIDKIKQLASEYQNLGLVGDEVAEAGIAQLAMFTRNVASLEKLMPNFENALIGLYGIEPTTGNAQGLATQIGKALSQGKTSSLSRLGITFTEAEQKAFALGNEIERAEIISNKLQNTFGNVNSELAKTPVGRIQQLKNAFSDVMELFGQAFTNIFASFVPVLQTIVGWLDAIARKLVEISEKIYVAFGGVLKKTGGSGIASALQEMAEGYEEVGSAAGSSKESIASFDNVVQLSDSSGSGSSGAGGGEFDFELPELVDNSELQETETIFDRIGKKIDEIFGKDLFNFEEEKKNLQSIGDSLGEIFGETKPYADAFIDSFIGNIKARIAAFIQIGKDTIGAFIAGIKESLEENKQRIIDDLTAIFGNLKDIYDDFTRIIKVIVDVISHFLHLDTTIKAIANVITVVTNVFNFVLKFVTTIIAQITDRIRKFYEDHKEQIDGFLKTVSEVFYEISETIKIAINGVIDFFNKYVMPVISWIIDGICDAVEWAVDFVINLVDGLLTAIKGVFEIINGILTGDSEKAWNGLKDVIKGVVNAVLSIVESMVNGIIVSINWLISGINKLKIPGTEIGLNIKPLNEVKIKRLAEGGIVYKETNFGSFIAGERGAEAIVPLQNSNYTKELAREIGKVISELGIGGTIYNIENAFGDERAMERLVRGIQETEKRMSARKGVVSYA